MFALLTYCWRCFAKNGICKGRFGAPSAENPRSKITLVGVQHCRLLLRRLQFPGFVARGFRQSTAKQRRTSDIMPFHSMDPPKVSVRKKGRTSPVHTISKVVPALCLPSALTAQGWCTDCLSLAAPGMLSEAEMHSPRKTHQSICIYQHSCQIAKCWVPSGWSDQWIEPWSKLSRDGTVVKCNGESRVGAPSAAPNDGSGHAQTQVGDGFASWARHVSNLKADTVTEATPAVAQRALCCRRTPREIAISCVRGHFESGTDRASLADVSVRASRGSLYGDRPESAPQQLGCAVLR